MATLSDYQAGIRAYRAAAGERQKTGTRPTLPTDRYRPDYSGAIANPISGGPVSHLDRLEQGNRMMAGVSPEAFGGQVRTAMQNIRSTVKADIAGGNYAQIGQHVRSAVNGLIPQNGTPGTAPRPRNPAARTARLTARKSAIDAAGAAYAARTDVSAQNKTRVAAAVANRDARLGARIAGSPVPARTALPGKTPGTTPLKDAFAGIRRRPRA